MLWRADGGEYEALFTDNTQYFDTGSMQSVTRAVTKKTGYSQQNAVNRPPIGGKNMGCECRNVY
jgi:hypothetical protein